MSGKTKISHAAILVANLIYGANFSIVKIAMPEYIKPAGFITLRVAFAAVLFWILEKVSRTSMKIEKQDYFKLFLLGLFGVAINQLLFFEGLSRTSNINAALIMTSNPVLVILMAGLLVGERITSVRVGGILLGIAGASCLILMSGTKRGNASMQGDAMIFVNALSYAIYLVQVKPLMRKYNAWVVIRWTFFFGFILVLPFGWKQVQAINWTSFTNAVWFSFIFVLFCTTFLAYLLNAYGLQYLSPSVVSFYIYLQPVFATVISLFISHEQLSVWQGVACLLIFTGVYLVSKPAVVRING